MNLKAFSLPAILLSALTIFGFTIPGTAKPSKTPVVSPRTTISISPKPLPQASAKPTKTPKPLRTTLPGMTSRPVPTSTLQPQTTVSPTVSPTPTPPSGWIVPTGGYNYLP